MMHIRAFCALFFYYATHMQPIGIMWYILGSGVCISVTRSQGGVLLMQMNVSSRNQPITEVDTVEGVRRGYALPEFFSD